MCVSKEGRPDSREKTQVTQFILYFTDSFTLQVDFASSVILFFQLFPATTYAICAPGRIPKKYENQKRFSTKLKHAKSTWKKAKRKTKGQRSLKEESRREAVSIE